MGKRLNLVGEKFNRFIVIDFSHVSGNRAYWKCICDCGEKTTVSSTHLRSGHTKSCGCLKVDKMTKHGKWGTRTYRTWQSMLSRCLRHKDMVYHRYGGRGIKVCKRWKKFENFYKDMGDRPKGKTIDRINNNGNYTPKNCKWSTRIEQGNNRRNNHLITAEGKIHTIAEWSRISKISHQTLRDRLNRGWSPEKAVLTEVC